MTRHNLAEAVCKVMDVEMRIKYLKARNEVIHAYADHKKVKEYFDYDAKYSLESGLTRMAEWGKKVGSKKSKKFDQIEIFKNMPQSWME